LSLGKSWSIIIDIQNVHDNLGRIPVTLTSAIDGFYGEIVPGNDLTVEGCATCLLDSYDSGYRVQIESKKKSKEYY